MATCRECHQEMTAGVGCTAFPGRPVFSDLDWSPDGIHCGDCHTPLGGMHHPGCDVEECDHGNQAIGDCPECEDLKHLPRCKREQLINGEWVYCEGCRPGALDYWQRAAT